ncbi:MAG TPA: 1-acyl-sn-glycerol-3-phosphate acyltransferase [Planctomycetota bacterium]|nr:1-acyl-sn-glycerol-3-phosphate acyltransferase [Planctomycetota bacterium]
MSIGESLGNCARKVIRKLVSFYYPRIEVTNAERIPQSGPVMFVANHPNSLVDPVIIGITAKRPVRFLAKAPLFEVPVFGRVMYALGMIPAFRGSDDPTQVSRNADSLGAGADILVSGDALGIFPEGKTHDAARVEMIRSGAARIAMQALEKGATTLKVVPLGINYERKEDFRTAVWVRVGEPIDVAEWLKKAEGDASKATRRLTGEIDRQLKELVVHLADEKLEPLVGDLETLFPPRGQLARQTLAPLRQRKRIADAMNYFLQNDRAKSEALVTSLTAHQQALAAEGLTMHSSVMRRGRRGVIPRMIGDLLWLIAFAVPALVGTIHHIIPFLLIRLIAPRVQTPGNTTVSLTRLLLGIPLYGAAYAFALWLMWRWDFRPWAMCAWLIPMPVAGIIALVYWPRAKAAARLWWLEVKLIMQRKRLAELRAAQATFEAQLQTLAAEYQKVAPIEDAAPLRSPWETVFSLRTLGWTGSSVACLGVVWMLFQFREKPIEELKNPAPILSTQTAAELARSISADEKALADVIVGLARLEQTALQLKQEFASGKRSYYTQEDNDIVRQNLLSFLNYRAALFRIVWKYQNHAQIGDEKLRARAFLANYTAAAVLHEAALKLVTQFNEEEHVKKLNEPEPLWNIPPKVYDRIRQNMMRFETQRLLSDAYAAYSSRGAEFEKFGMVAAPPYADFHEAIARSKQVVEALGPSIWKEKAVMSVTSATETGKKAAYEVQSLIAIWIGDTKIRSPRKGATLIGDKRAEELRALMKPGDILLERRNWFLSNAFLPGYWPHAALYVGTPEELAALGLDKDPRVSAHWEEFSKRDEHGHPHVIVEALSEGVVCATIEHSIGGGDSVAVLRPRLPPEKIKEAICRGFSHMGKAYDFEFDFFSTDKIVCTELVFRAYDGMVKFELVDVMGRKTLPAIEMVKKFNAEYEKPEAQLEFIAFIDGEEKTGEAQTRDVKAFMHTVKRPGMTWLQGLVPDE